MSLIYLLHSKNFVPKNKQCPISDFEIIKSVYSKFLCEKRYRKIFIFLSILFRAISLIICSTKNEFLIKVETKPASEGTDSEVVQFKELAAAE